MKKNVRSKVNPDFIVCCQCGKEVAKFVMKRKRCLPCNRYYSYLLQQLKSPKVQCECGCGMLTHSLNIKGSPQRYIVGHRDYESEKKKKYKKN